MPSSSKSSFILLALIATIGIGMAFPTLSGAADGTKDPTFNAGGVGPNHDVLAIAMQSDGKVVIGGFFTDYNGDASASDRVMRLNVDGTRDMTFNAGGTGADATVYALALQADGKILIGGQFTSYNGDAVASDFVMRLNADGTRDMTFNAGGTGANDYVWAFAVQPDGKIVVGGNFFTYDGSPVSGRVMRLNNDGTPDTAFNVGGSRANGTVSAVALQPDGKIVIGGLFTSYDGDDGSSDYVMRLNADGTRDTSFNPAGTGADHWVHAIALQPDGKILIGGDFGGYNGDPGASDKLMRLGADGTRDTSFNAGGAGADATVESVAAQPDGKIVIGGSFITYNGDAGTSRFVMRLNADGTPDTTFNPGGAGASAVVNAIALQADGKIVIGGRFTGYDGDRAGPAYVMRLSSTAGPVCSGAPANIIAWWPGGGDARDIVGHYDGTLQSGATFGTGLVGQAFSLDGLDDGIVVDDTPALNPTSITVEAWIKPDGVPAGTLKDVVTKWGFDATIDSYFLGLINSGGVVKVQGAIGDGATGDSGFSGGSVPLDTWSHIAMTYDAASGLNRLYLNGAAVGERVRAHGIYRTTSRVFIGREDSNNNRFFSGLIDEPAIYGRALTDAEILAIYNAGSNGKCASSTPNTSPAITVLSGLARQQGSDGTQARVAGVSDAETAAGNLTVTVSSAPAGISVTNIVNVGGAITADVSAGCAAATGDNTIVMQVSDGSLTASANLIVNVTPNLGPVLTYASSRSVALGKSLTVNPTSGPSDNGSISSILLQSRGTYTGDIAVDNSTGVVSISKAGPVGAHSITMRATDSCGAFNDATLALTVTGAKIDTDTLASVKPVTSVYGRSVTFTAHVTPATGAGTPTGTVQFYADGAPLGAPQNVSGGDAELTTIDSAVGTHSITAAYSGDGGFNGSSSRKTRQQVNQASTSTGISTNPSPSYPGLTVTIQANVTAVAPGGGTPTGSVTFMDGRRFLATVPLAAGQASFTTSSLTVGTHTIVASYGGAPSYNGSFKSTSHQVLEASVTSGFIVPSNGGWVQFSVTRTSTALTGNLTYSRDNSMFFGTKVISLVIDGQMATIEGFSSDGQLFVATAYDGGPRPFDRFQLWIEGVEQTAGGAIRAGDVTVYPWGPDTRLKGWVDLHTHPMSNLAFGGKLFHGAPDAGSLMPAVEMPWDSACRFDNRAINIYEALSQDGPTHGPPLVPPFGWNPCGNVLRFGIILALEGFNDAHISPPQAVGYPSFRDWPKWDDITHQKMWIDWIKRDWEGGLRVMVALSHNNRMLADVVGIGGGGPISGVRNDKDSSDLQIDEIKKLVAAHSDWMAIARSSAELRSIVQANKLAVVLGVEIDKIGDFSTDGSVTEDEVDLELSRLYDQGVRYIFPIHLTDNAFGDTAIYQALFNVANVRETGYPWSVGCGQEADEVGFRSPGFPPELDPFIPPGTPDPPRAPDCLLATRNGPIFSGHVNTRTSDGLTSLGKFALKAMMKRGMIIDIDHMSDRAANWALGFANFPGGGYPLMSGHTGIRDRHSEHLHAENARTKDQLAQVACLGGMFGLGTDGMPAFTWAAAYNEAYDIMRRAFAPGRRCQEFTPLSMSFIGLGTDMNSLVRTPPPPAPRFTDIYNPGNPINAGLSPLIKSTTGDRTWDYNFDGVAHYGMYVDFLRDVRTCSGDPTNTCQQIVDDELNHSAENFYRMWLKAETQKARVP